MELFPYQDFQNQVVISLGLMFDTDIPAGGERSIQDTFNDCLNVRELRTDISTIEPFSRRYLPQRSEALYTNASFLPIQTEYTVSNAQAAIFAGIPRIVPRVKLTELDSRMSENLRTRYNESVAAYILTHRMRDIGDFYTGTSSVIWARINPVYNKTVEGWSIFAEYDFGAEIELSGLVGVVAGSHTNGPMALAIPNTFLQVQINGVWQDVINTYTNLRVTSNLGTASYRLPTAIRATKFRHVCKQDTADVISGLYPYGIQFYARYVDVKPRTIGKVKHLSVIPSNYSAGSTVRNGWTFIRTQTTVAESIGGTCFPMFHFSVTDDYSQRDAHDIYVQDATYEPGMYDMSLPVFCVRYDSTKGRGI